MKIYHYHKKTGELINESEARLDPLETKKQGRDIYAVPANATDIKPPKTKKNEVPVFVKVKWEVKSDYRGTVYYDVDATKYIIAEVGFEVPENCTTTPPADGMKKPHWDGSKWGDLYVEPEIDPDELPITITAGALKLLKKAKTPDEFVQIFKDNIN